MNEVQIIEKKILRELKRQLPKIYNHLPHYGDDFDDPEWSDESAHSHTDVSFFHKGATYSTHVKVGVNWYQYSVPFGHPDAGVTGESDIAVQNFSTALYAAVLAARGFNGEPAAWTYIFVETHNMYEGFEALREYKILQNEIKARKAGYLSRDPRDCRSGSNYFNLSQIAKGWDKVLQLNW